MNKLFIVRKYIKARSIEDALKKDKVKKVDEIWVDEQWKEKNINKIDSKVIKGF